jgi:uncharacterized protein YukE
MLPTMPTLPDPAALCAVADRIAGHAAAARDRATRLDQAGAATGWTGAAALAFLSQLQLASSSLRYAAGRLDDAAEALRHHAAQVGALLGDIARLGTAEVGLVDDLVHLRPDRALGDVGDIVGSAGSIVGDALHVIGL